MQKERIYYFSPLGVKSSKLIQKLFNAISIETKIVEKNKQFRAMKSISLVQSKFIYLLALN